MTRPVQEADLLRTIDGLGRRVAALERKRPAIAQPLPQSCTCPDNEGFALATGTGIAASTVFHEPTWTSTTSTGLGVNATSGNIETTEAGLYACAGMAFIDAGTTTLSFAGARLLETSAGFTTLGQDDRPGIAVTTGGVGNPKVNAITISGVWAIPTNGRIDFYVRAVGASFNYTATLWVMQVSKFPST